MDKALKCKTQNKQNCKSGNKHTLLLKDKKTNKKDSIKNTEMELYTGKKLFLREVGLLHFTSLNNDSLT